jgi:hypothetical protein
MGTAADAGAATGASAARAGLRRECRDYTCQHEDEDSQQDSTQLVAHLDLLVTQRPSAGTATLLV